MLAGYTNYSEAPQQLAALCRQHICPQPQTTFIGHLSHKNQREVQEDLPFHKKTSLH